jgi:hypothetical protein
MLGPAIVSVSFAFSVTGISEWSVALLELVPRELNLALNAPLGETKTRIIAAKSLMIDTLNATIFTEYRRCSVLVRYYFLFML